MTTIYAPDGWVPNRIAVGAGIFVLYFTHYISLLLHVKGGTESKEYLNRRVYLYSITGLLSMTFIQGSVFQAILAWLTLIPLVLLHLTSCNESFKPLALQNNNLWVVYYFLQFVWFFGLIIDFYTI